MRSSLDVLGSPQQRRPAAWSHRDDRPLRGSAVPVGPEREIAAPRHRSERWRGPGGASVTVRRFKGPMAEELFVQCRPDSSLADAARQAEALYEMLLDTVASAGATPEAIVSETVFLRRVRDDLEAVHSARARVLGETGRAATTFIGQAPLDGVARLELSAVAVVPRPGVSSSAHEVIRPSACRCDACAPGARATIARLGDHTSLHAGNIYGTGRHAVEEVVDMFRVAEGLLAGAGMSFRDVVRTWIHVRDIDRDYAALNDARREFFGSSGIVRRPASTGVQGMLQGTAHDFSLSFHAVTSPRPLEITPMHTPLLNEAWTYGADFSRGLRVVDSNKVTLHVSGTASIDEAGRSVHVGNFTAQVDRMLHNIASLLVRQGSSFEDVVSAITYVKHPSDAPRLRSMLRARGFDDFPCAIVEAPLCRPELLCETEAVAALPIATAGA